MHTVSRGYFEQPPMPSQMPVWPQLARPGRGRRRARSGVSASSGQQRALAARQVAGDAGALAGDVAADPVGAEAGRALVVASRRWRRSSACRSFPARMLAADALAAGRAGVEAGAGARVARERHADARRARLAVPAAVADGRADDRVAVARARLAQRVLPDTCGSRRRRRTCRRSRRSTPAVFVHVVESRGSSPAVRITHVPTESGALQVLQPSVQAVVQQTPSTQKPLAHCAVARARLARWPSACRVVSQTVASAPPTSARSPDGVSVFGLRSPIDASPPSGFDEPFLQPDAGRQTSASSAATPTRPTIRPNATSCFR